MQVCVCIFNFGFGGDGVFLCYYSYCSVIFMALESSAFYCVVCMVGLLIYVWYRIFFVLGMDILDLLIGCCVIEEDLFCACIRND